MVTETAQFLGGPLDGREMNVAPQLPVYILRDKRGNLTRYRRRGTKHGKRIYVWVPKEET